MKLSSSDMWMTSCIWPNDMALDTCVLRLNSLVPSVQFSVEKEMDFKLPFFDVLMNRVDKRFKFTVNGKAINV